MIDPSFGLILLDNNNRGDESIFLFDESIFIFPDYLSIFPEFYFPGEKLAKLGMSID